MTPAEQIAADAAAHYGVPCRPEVVHIIPRGVSGECDLTGMHWREIINTQRAAAIRRDKRIRRLEKAK